MSSPLDTTQKDQLAPGVVSSMLRYWRLTLLIVITFALVALGVSVLLPKRFEATARVELLDLNADAVFSARGALPVDLERDTEDQVIVMTSASVLSRAAEALDKDSLEDIESKVEASTNSPGQIHVTAEADSRVGAAVLANAVVTAYKEVTRENIRERANDNVAALESKLQESDAALAALNQELSENPDDASVRSRRDAAGANAARLRAKADDIQINADAFGDGVSYTDPAREPESPVEPKPGRNAAVASLLGLLVAGALAWYRADRHRSADDSAVPSAVLDAPLLGTIPVLSQDKDMGALRDGSSAAAESYQVVTASLQHVFRWGVLLITSGGRGDGKTISAASIAATAARDGTRVVLVDADVRASALTERLLGAAERWPTGLSDVVQGRATIEDAVRLLRISDDVTLPFLHAGTSVEDIGSLFRTVGMTRTLQRLREAFDLVIIDCAPLLAVADVASLAMHADGIVTVVRRGTPISMLDAVRQRLDMVAAPLVGYIFTRAEGSARSDLSSSPLPAHISRSAHGERWWDPQRWLAVRSRSRNGRAPVRTPANRPAAMNGTSTPNATPANNGTPARSGSDSSPSPAPAAAPSGRSNQPQSGPGNPGERR